MKTRSAQPYAMMGGLSQRTLEAVGCSTWVIPNPPATTKGYLYSTILCRASCAKVFKLFPSACASRARRSCSSGGIRMLNLPE